VKGPHPWMFWIYRCTLAFYPLRLRYAYRDQMLQTLRDAHAEHGGNAAAFWLHAFSDLLHSSFMERLYMLREQVFRRPVEVYTLILAVVFTLLGGAAALTMQQMLRRGANQPQIDMADWYSGEIASGEKPGNVIPPGYVDLEKSLQPFVIFYDELGRPLAGTGYLDQALPVPPAGVFDFVRSHGRENLTWQPRPGVRMASVIRRVDAKTSGFILAGRSLRLVEEQESLLWRMVMGIWLAVMGLLLGGAFLLNRSGSKPQPAA